MQGKESSNYESSSENINISRFEYDDRLLGKSALDDSFEEAIEPLVYRQSNFKEVKSIVSSV